MAQLNLKIVTPKQQIYDDTVDQVNISTSEGEIGILPNHTNLMAKIIPGELMIRKNGKTEVLAVGEGFLSVTGNVLTIMADLAINEENINEKAVEEAKKRAEQVLEQKLSDEEYAETFAALEKSLAQLRVKRRHRRSI